MTVPVSHGENVKGLCTANKKCYPTLVQIKSSIPARLFESNLVYSLYYLLKDITLVSALFMSIRFAEAVLPAYLLCIAYPVYWFLQGTVMMAVFVLGHDCGHGSFSRFGILNDFIGTVLHTFLLTPYYSWKISHRNHHKNTGNIDKDEVFYPVRKGIYNGEKFVWYFGLGIAWFIYLLRGYRPRRVCHFNPFESMFINHLTGCTLSLMAIASWVGCLTYYACVAGIWDVAKYYLLPEMVFASWLLIVTFLHHTETQVPWYSDENWNYVKGQLSSVDRHYGWAHALIHNIGTHQIHHLFTKIPHYNLEVATAHFRKSYPDLVRICDDPILPAFCRMFKSFAAQHVISDDSSIHVYK